MQGVERRKRGQLVTGEGNEEVTRHVVCCLSFEDENEGGASVVADGSSGGIANPTTNSAAWAAGFCGSKENIALLACAGD